MSKIIKGKALWAKVFEPDTKFDANGVYSISVLVPETEAQEMCECLDRIVEERLATEVKEKPKLKGSLTTRQGYEKATDQDGNETGEIEFKVKLKAKIQGKDGSTYTQKPIVVDAKRTPMNKESLIGNGSTVKVAFEPFAYAMMSTKQVGVSLRLKGVQVLELVEFGGANSMFEEEEGFTTNQIEKAMEFEENHADF
tara:strand:- start:6957 stop:7547 length:591 start_codon:yes stop_codon:yes gene_type:complete